MPAPQTLTSRATALPAPALVLVAVASVQSGSAVARHLFDAAGAGGVTLLRLGLSAVILLALVRPRVRGLTAQAWGAAALFGLTLASMNFVFYQAIELVPLGVAVTVEFVGPLAVALAGARRGLHVLWVVLAGTGVVLLAGADSADVDGRGTGALPVRGLLLAALAGAFWAGYILISKRVGTLLPGTTGLALALPVAALAVLPFGLSGATSGLAHQPGTVLAGGLAVATLSSLVPYSLELAALRRMSASVFGVLMSLEPAGAALAGLLLLGQRLNLRECLALVLVSLASVGVTLSTHEPVPVQPLE